MNLRMFQSFTKIGRASTPAWLHQSAANAAEGLGKSIAGSARETAEIIGEGLNPAKVGRTLKSMANTDPAKKKELLEDLKNVPAHLRGQYVADSGGALRRAGLLRNQIKYVGETDTLAGKARWLRNRAARMTPGESVQVPLIGAQSLYDSQQIDPNTGRKRGVAERAGRGLMGFGSGVIGARKGGFVAGAVADELATRIGGKAGRTLDAAVSRGDQMATSQPSIASPPARGANLRL